MKRVSRIILQLIIILTSYQQSRAQNINIDSLAQSINGEQIQLIQLEKIERALDALILQNQETFEHFLKKLDKSNLTTLELLLLDSYNARKLVSNNEFEEVLKLPSQANPFIRYYQGSIHFAEGNVIQAIKTFHNTANLLDSYNDTIYLASTLNNLGAIHWHLDNLDSALIYFQRAKQLTFWYNNMLENNILAIANALDDKNLAEYQIRTILSNSNDADDPYFLVNSIQFYKKHDAVKLDSVLNNIKTSYENLSQVPIEILPEFIRQGWYLDSLAFVMLKLQSNSFYDDALNALLTHTIISDSSFTEDVLHNLAAKANNPIDSNLSEIMGKLSYPDRLILAKTIQLLESEQRKEILVKLNHAAQDFKILIENKSSELRIAIITGLSLLTICLIIIVIVQNKNIAQIKEKSRLSKLNSELAAENSAMQNEINQVRSKIDLLTTNSIKRIKELRNAVEALGTDSQKTIEILNDLNIITTYEEGMLRFRINNVVNGVTTKSIEKLKSHIGERNVLVLKLTIMNFSSKEIALILGVSPQHVQNIRSRIKSKIEDVIPEGYNNIIAKIKSEFPVI